MRSVKAFPKAKVSPWSSEKSVNEVRSTPSVLVAGLALRDHRLFLNSLLFVTFDCCVNKRVRVTDRCDALAVATRR